MTIAKLQTTAAIDSKLTTTESATAAAAPYHTGGWLVAEVGAL